MTTDLTVRQPPQMTTLDNQQLAYIAQTEFVPPGLRGNLPAILACVATGRALGIADMTALRSIHVIDGKASFSAELMVMLVRQRGHSITGEVTDEAATITGTRGDNGDTMTYTFTTAMADRAGLLNKSNWKKYTESMLWARAVSQLCRMLFPDCFAGATYTTEELGEEVTDEHGASLAEGEHSGEAASAETRPSPSASDASLAEGGMAGLASPSDSEGSPPSASDEIAAAAEGLPPVDLDDPDIPFGDAPASPLLERDSKMWRKLNVQIGKLRDGDNLTTEHLYRAVKKDPDKVPGSRDADGVLHFGPLRDSLTKAEAMSLIDRLERYEQNLRENQ